MESPVIPLEEFIWAVGSIAQLNHLPFDPSMLRQSVPPPHGFHHLAEALERYGFKCVVHAKLPKAQKMKLPCLVECRSGEDAPPSSSLALAIKVDSDSLWLFVPGDKDPTRILLLELPKRLTGRTLQFVLKQKPLQDPDTADRASFGFGWFVPVLLKHKAIWRDVLAASFVMQLMALATPLFTQVIIDKVVVHQTTSTLVVIGIALAVFMIFNALLSWNRQYLILHTGNRIDAYLGTRVFEHLFSLPLGYFEHRATGVIAARMQAVETVREFIASSIVTLVLDLPFLLVFVAVMFYYSVPLTLLVLAILGTIALLSGFVAPILRSRLNGQFVLGARNQAFLTEYIASLETVKSLQMEPQLARRWREYLATYLDAGLDTRQVANTYNVAANTLEQLMTLLVLTLGAWMVMAGAAGGEVFTIGMLVAFQMFAARLSQPMLRLVGLWQQFQQASISVKRLADIMDAPAEHYAVTPSREIKRQGRIEIIDVAFRYGGDRPFLYQHVNITLLPGTTTLLTGPSGSGKSTLAKLLQGFYEPTVGHIRIDGVDIRHLAVNELRASFGVVPQDTNLFSGSIYENLTAANPLATFEQVINACKMAEIHTAIEALPNGYQTAIGERGVGLSGGQKQRLAIARALLKRPSILIFDEATSALDNETAEHFAQTINALRGKVSMLFITHQAPKNLQVDQVISIGEKRLSVVAGSAENVAEAAIRA